MHRSTRGGGTNPDLSAAPSTAVVSQRNTGINYTVPAVDVVDLHIYWRPVNSTITGQGQAIFGIAVEYTLP